MPFNTLSVATATTPAFLKTFFQHFLDKPSRESPRHQFTYDEALVLVKKFLEYGSKHTVEQVQSFTANKIPTPSWVSKTEVDLPQTFLDKAADVLIDHLGPEGLRLFGGKHWWQWRLEALKCEWVEMKSDKNKRESNSIQSDGVRRDRIILYIHGGAYYFGSVDEHRYQIQRHARKLGGRAFAANYRLAPQYPAPCGIQDNLAAYLYLLEQFQPNQIILSGDSAGGGKCLALLTVLRDQGIPLPAGCVLISPWVDLNHSFPSILADSSGDYIPPSGFQHKPSISWPPPTSTDIAEARNLEVSEESEDDSNLSDEEEDQANNERLGYTIEGTPRESLSDPSFKNSDLDPDYQPPTASVNDTRIMIDGKMVAIHDQIQLYATNEQISHPLVSPVVAGSLGGLCPLFILAGGAELLRDEIIYIAHKAANPTAYPPMNFYLDRENGRQRALLEKYSRGTPVHLQIYDHCCHVTPTIAMCRPAKYMYRGIANFSLWALARADKEAQADIVQLLQEMELVSTMAEEADHDSADDSESSIAEHKQSEISRGQNEIKVTGVEPEYVDNMIRERVDIHGLLRPMESVSEMPMLHLPPTSIGAIKQGPVKKWMAARANHDSKYKKRKAKLQRQRAREYARAELSGFHIGDFKGDQVPPSALAGRASLADAVSISKASKGKKSGLINTLFSRVNHMPDEELENVKNKVRH